MSSYESRRGIYGLLIVIVVTIAFLLTFRGMGAITSASPPSPSLTINDVTVTEPNLGDPVTYATFTITLDPPIPDEWVWVQVTTVGPSGTATGGEDYVIVDMEVDFPPGSTVQNVNVPIYGDTLNEGEEFFVVTLNNHSPNVNIKGGSGKGTILDNYHPGSFSFLSSGDYSHIEDDWTFTITVLRTGGNVPSSVNWNTSDFAGTATPFDDFISAAGVLNFAYYETSKTFQVTIKEDLLVEPDETVILRLSNPTNGATIPADPTRNLTILNDDSSKFEFKNISYSIVEGNATVTVTVKRNGDNSCLASIGFSTEGVTATEGTDFDNSSGTLTFNPGVSEMTFDVQIHDDTQVENSETIELYLNNPTGCGSMDEYDECYITILDNDVVPTRSSVQFSSAQYEVNEGQPFAVITVNRTFINVEPSGAIGSNNQVAPPVMVDYTLTNDTAIAGQDYNASPMTGTLTFGPNEMSKTFIINIVDDLIPEGDEYLDMTLSNVRNAIIGQPNPSGLIIHDNDNSVIKFKDAFYTIGEGSGFATITVVREGGDLFKPAYVDYMTSEAAENNHAKAQTDFGMTSGTLMFDQGVTTLTFTIPIFEDVLMEGKEMFNLVLANPKYARLGNPNSTVVVIMDNEVPQPGRLQFSSPVYTVNENSSNAEIWVLRTNGDNMPVTVRYIATPVTATMDQDFGHTEGVLSFAAGETAKSFMVRIYHDDLGEGMETVKLTLYEATGGAEMGMTEAMLNITDGDSFDMSRTVDFGTVSVGEAVNRTVSIRNITKEPISISTPVIESGSEFGFSISSQPTLFLIEPNQTSTFEVSFRPMTESENALIGSIRINSSKESAVITLSGTSSMMLPTPPEISVMSPTAGEVIKAGSQVRIRFWTADSNLMGSYLVVYSTDGGATFTNEIARLGPTETEVIWNVPDNLETDLARIKVMGRSSGGQIGSAMSEIFTVQKPPSDMPMLQVVLTLEQPVPDNAGSRSIKVKASEFIANAQRIDDMPSLEPEFSGYNIYRVLEPAPGEPLPAIEQIVTPSNLVGTVGEGKATFNELVSTVKGDNFIYVVKGFFEDDNLNGVSAPAGTDLPVIKNLFYRKGSFFMEPGGSFIKEGAVLVVSGNEYPLLFSRTDALFMVKRNARGTPGGFTLRQLLKKNPTVWIQIKNPDDNRSVVKNFTLN